ncbi:MAG: cysteine-rich VLP domain-containing protein [Oscillospiraceae bacterium]|nr:cysteine-rich VLP domain-containing protein [Oscillospiraceae bacterium]
MADLPRMNDRQFHHAKRLIRRLCANYDGGSCLPLDDGDNCPCPQFITPVLICKYFRAAVLPADRELYAAVMEGKPVKNCCICGVPLYSRSNAAKYCPPCARRERRRRDAARKRNRPGTSANRGLESPAPQAFQTEETKQDKDLSLEG